MFGLFNKRENPFEGYPMEDLEGELWIIAGKQLGERWNLVDIDDEFLCGRHLESEDDISFDNSATTVSKRHCKIRKTDERFELEDLGSSNGTFLNKKKVEGTVELYSGDEITLGTNEVTFKFTVTDVSAQDEDDD